MLKCDNKPDDCDSEENEYNKCESEQLKLNYKKVREIIGDDNYKHLILNTVKEYIVGNSYHQVCELLKNEGILATKRENSLDNLLDV